MSGTLLRLLKSRKAVRTQQVVENGTLREMKKCLLALPILTVPLMGTYVLPGWDRRNLDVADVVIGLTGTVVNVPTFAAMGTVLGRTQYAITLDDANFRIEVDRD